MFFIQYYLSKDRVQLFLLKLLFSVPCILSFNAVILVTAVFAEEKPPIEQIVKRLQQGGLVVYFRHAQTDRSFEDQHPVDVERCDTQRNLSEHGKQQASDIGGAFDRLSIPIAEVLSSPFCRCKDTARLAFKEFEVNKNLYFAVALTKDQRHQQSLILRELITTKPMNGNRVIVSHTSNLREAVALWPKQEGAAYVFEPLGEGKFKTLGIISPEGWNNLASVDTH